MYTLVYTKLDNTHPWPIRNCAQNTLRTRILSVLTIIKNNIFYYNYGRPDVAKWRYCLVFYYKQKQLQLSLIVRFGHMQLVFSSSNTEELNFFMHSELS